MTDLDNPEIGSSKQTILNAPEPTPAQAPQTWPDNWRQEMAGGDEKELKRLERMKAPTDVYKSYRELEKLKSSFTPPPKRPSQDSTPEEIAAYREAMGLPADPKGYDLNFGDGTVIGDDLMPAVEGYLKYAHENHLSPEHVKGQLKWYMDDVKQEQERIYQMNDEARVNGLAELKSKWGGEFKGNLNSIQSLFTDAPEGFMESVMQMRDANGLYFANNPANIEWLVGIAKAINPTASLIPSGANDSASIDSELEKLTAQMHSKDPAERKKYWDDPKAQDRFLKLTQHKQSSR